MHVRPDSSRTVPLLVVGLGGILGVGLDLFDIATVAIGGPRWLHQLDVLTAVLLTLVIGGLGAYSRRRDRTRGSTEDSQWYERAD